MTKITPDMRLRAIHLLLQFADERLPDVSRTAKPYEVSATELRDIDRIAVGQLPRTALGRRAVGQAIEEATPRKSAAARG